MPSIPSATSSRPQVAASRRAAVAFRITCLAAALLACLTFAAPSRADPVGTYDVVGTNPGSDGTYGGTVTVTRTGDTYDIVWMIAGTRFDGTGLGARVVDGQYLVGPARPDDVSLSVGYVSGGSFGIAIYFEGADGSWQGVWTYDGSDRIATERWTPR